MNECHTNDQQKEVEIMKVCICMCIWQMLSQSSMVLVSLGISQQSCAYVMFHAQSLQDTLTSLQWIEYVNTI